MTINTMSITDLERYTHDFATVYSTLYEIDKKTSGSYSYFTDFFDNNAPELSETLQQIYGYQQYQGFADIITSDREAASCIITLRILGVITD